MKDARRELHTKRGSVLSVELNAVVPACYARIEVVCDRRASEEGMHTARNVHICDAAHMWGNT